MNESVIFCAKDIALVEQAIGEPVVSAEHVTRITRQRGTGYVNDVFNVNGKFRVTVYRNWHDQWTGKFYDSASVRPLAEVLDEKKRWGRRVARLAKKAGVPWEIGAMAGHIENDEEAIEVMATLRELAGYMAIAYKSGDVQYLADTGLYSSFADWRHELLECGINKRRNALLATFGNVMDEICCTGQRGTSILAAYVGQMLPD